VGGAAGWAASLLARKSSRAGVLSASPFAGWCRDLVIFGTLIDFNVLSCFI